jgi:hypothetical protein
MDRRITFMPSRGGIYTALIMISKTSTPDFPVWRSRFAAIKPVLAACKAQSLSQLETLFSSLFPFHLLSETDEGENSRDRVFTSRRTFWGFLWQALTPNTSCRAVVQQVSALFALQGRETICASDSAYCQGRVRLPQEPLDKIMVEAARTADSKARGWQWHGRAVKAVDSTSATLADTEANQAEFPQSNSQDPGCGFPLMKITVFMSLDSGAVLNKATGNKHVSELHLFRKLWDQLEPNDIILTDDAFSDYATLEGVPKRKADAVSRLQRRHKDFRQGKKLGPNDRLVTWKKPSTRPKTVSAEDWEKVDQTIQVRMLRFRVDIPGFRSKEINIVTTLLDPIAYPLEQVAALFRRRWRLELCFRDIKTTMKMEHLKCKTPEMVLKELTMFLIAYNFIRCLMAESAATHSVDIERISFKGSVDITRSHSQALAQAKNQKQRKRLHWELLEILAQDLLPDRPNRVEPRAVKRRPKPHALLNKHRSLYKDVPHRSRCKKAAPRPA